VETPQKGDGDHKNRSTAPGRDIILKEELINKEEVFLKGED
jgi:hypothetical protein